MSAGPEFVRAPRTRWGRKTSLFQWREPAFWLYAAIVLVTAANAGAFAADRLAGAWGGAVAGLSGYEDFVRLTIGCAALMFMPHAQARRGHVAVDIFVEYLPVRLRRGGFDVRRQHAVVQHIAADAQRRHQRHAVAHQRPQSARQSRRLDAGNQRAGEAASQQPRVEGVAECRIAPLAIEPPQRQRRQHQQHYPPVAHEQADA